MTCDIRVNRVDIHAKLRDRINIWHGVDPINLQSSQVLQDISEKGTLFTFWTEIDRGLLKSNSFAQCLGGTLEQFSFLKANFMGVV